MLCSTSLPSGNLVDGLPLVLHNTDAGCFHSRLSPTIFPVFVIDQILQIHIFLMI